MGPHENALAASRRTHASRCDRPLFLPILCFIKNKKIFFLFGQNSALKCALFTFRDSLEYGLLRLRLDSVPQCDVVRVAGLGLLVVVDLQERTRGIKYVFCNLFK